MSKTLLFITFLCVTTSVLGDDWASWFSNSVQATIEDKWYSAQELWDSADNARNATELNAALSGLGNLLVSTLYVETTDHVILGNSNAFLNYIRNTEAPAYDSVTRYSANPTVLATSTQRQSGVNIYRVKMSFIVTHYLTRVATQQVPVPQPSSQIEKAVVLFQRRDNNQNSDNWFIEAIDLTLLESEKDDLIAEIIALREENARLRAVEAELARQQALYDQHYHTIRVLYDDVVYPNQIPVVTEGKLPNVFNNGVKGRIHPVGTFTNAINDTIEYFYGLSPFTGTQFITKTNIIHFANNGNIAASEVHLTFTNNITGAQRNLTQKGFWRFDDDGLVIEYDLDLINLGLSAIATGNDYRNNTVRQATIARICPVIQQRCVGSNQQYSSVQDCVNFMNSIEYGTPDIYWDNSVVCRTLHLTLTQYRPEVHCPHVGPTGGGKCVPKNYASIYVPLFDTLPRLIE